MTDVRFGTDGIRGVAGTHPITEGVAYRLGGAVIRALGVERLVVAHDTRPHGADLSRALCAGAEEAGATVSLMGVWPTPALACELYAGGGDAAIMVTASHNPVHDNGFKILARGGKKPDSNEIKAIEDELNGTCTARVDAMLAPAGGGTPAAWLARLEQEVAGLKDAWGGRAIAFDFANGAAAPFHRQIVAMMPAQWTVMGIGEGRINDGVGSESLTALGRTVVAKGCSLGFAVDGDADRLRVVDEQGHPVAGDAVTWLLCQDRGLTDLAVTIMSNGALEEHLPGVRITRTPVGDKHLQAVMASEGIELGAEESGHILFGDHPGGDGCFAAFRVLRALGARQETVSEAFAGFRPHPRVQRKIPVSGNPPLEDLADLPAWREEWLVGLGTTGRVLLRYSGTEPVLRILVEGSNLARVTETADDVASRMRGALP